MRTMRLPDVIFVASLLLLGSCDNTTHETGKKLSVRDLKFPAVYNIEWLNNEPVGLLPKTDVSFLSTHHIRSMFSYIDPGKIDEYPARLQEFYKETKQAGESFNDWFWHQTGCLDTANYDEQGQILIYSRNALNFGRREYGYDSMGLRAMFRSGGCNIHYYYSHYSFDPDTRTLYFCDTGTRLTADEHVAKLHFDTSGYLMSLAYTSSNFGCVINMSFVYNEHKQISSITRRDSIVPGSEHSKEPWPVTVGSTSTFYYNGSSPDSIITNYMVNLKEGVHHTHKIYFDSTGLPSRTVYINDPEYRRSPEVRKYRYHTL